MLKYLILLFTIVPAVELALLIKIGQYIGVLSTLAIIIFTGILGAYLARLEGFLTLRRIQEDLSQGRVPTDKLFDGVLILCSGALLLTPGFLTDLLGFMGLFPLTRNLLKKWLKKKIEGMISRGEVITITSFKSR